MPRIINSQVGSTKAFYQVMFFAQVHSVSRRWRQGPRRYCCDQCKLDVHALRRAKALLNRVGIIRFHELLDQL